MEIYLIRHTTPDIEKGICYGQADIGITDTFEEEFLSVEKQVPSGIPIISSPLSRCKILAEKLSNNVTFDDRLMELNFGDWELKKWDDIPSSEITPWFDDFVNTPCKNGESYTQLYNRVIECYTEIKQSSHLKVGIVTHAGVMRSILAHHEGVALKKSFDFKLGYGEVIKITNGA